MKLKAILSLLLLPLLFSACGGDDDDFWEDGRRNVKEVYIGSDAIQLGTDVRVDVYFETETEFGSPKDLQLVIKLPPALMYRVGTSKLYFSNHNKDTRSPDYVTECDDGTSYMFYDLDDDDDLGWVAIDRYDMSFYAIGVERSEMAVISARAGKYLHFSCDSEFHPQEASSVAVR
ncbi:MAG: hypothetical protein ACOX2O_06875 [Bdellovibrionota bacterium]